MTLVLSPLSGQPNEVLELPSLGQSSQLCIALDSTALPVSVDTSGVANVSSVPGATATSALDQLQADIAALTSSSIPNTSAVPGATVTDALTTLSTTTRRVFANPASARVGTSFAGVIVEAATTWTTAAEVPPGQFIEVVCFAASAGAASGQTGTNTSGCNGGPGSGGGALHRERFARAEVLAALPIVMTCPLGGIGGAAVETFGSPVVAGVPGVAPTGPTLAGTLCSAFPSAGGNSVAGTGAQLAGGGGGGWCSAGTGGRLDTAANVGGEPNPGVGLAQSNSGCGGGSCLAGQSATFIVCIFGGAPGAGSTATAAAGDVTNRNGRQSLFGGCGGAAGASVGAANAVCAGSRGGTHSGVPGVAGGAAGTTAAGAGGNGQTGADGDINHCGEGGSGGGSSSQFGTTLEPIGGDGGDGGFPGGGAGGGGAACRNGGNTLGTKSGKGGRGADSAIAWTFFP